MKQLLHFINRIFYLETSDMPSILIIPGKEVFIEDISMFKELPIAGLAECEVTSSLEDKNNLFTIKLSAELCADFHCIGSRFLFMIKSVDGSAYLIGNGVPPFPEVSTTELFPTKADSTSGYKLTVQYTCQAGLLKLLS